jgi:KDO2-lipid IV(A) lauroyltransferase
MTEPALAPHLRWLFCGGERQRAAYRYWINDTARGLLNVAVHSGMRPLPTDLCSGFGSALAWSARLRFPESDARARRLMQSLQPTLAGHHLDRAMRRLWRSVARTMAEFSVLPRLWAESRIAVEGLHHLQAARAAGRPLLIAGLHLGNWEVIGHTLVSNGFPTRAIYEVPENRFDHYIAVQSRRRYGAQLIFPDHTGGRSAYRSLLARQGEALLIYVDEIFRGEVSAPAFGRARPLRGNIAHVARLARLTGAAVIACYCLRLGDRASFKVTFLPSIEFTRTEDRRSDLAANILEIDRIIAPVVETHLDQWFYALDFEF